MIKDAQSNLEQVCRSSQAVTLAIRTVKSLLAGVMDVTRLLCTIFVMSVTLIQRYFMKKEPKKYKYPQKQVDQHTIAFEGNIKSLTKSGRITTHKYKGKEK